MALFKALSEQSEKYTCVKLAIVEPASPRSCKINCFLFLCCGAVLLQRRYCSLFYMLDCGAWSSYMSQLSPRLFIFTQRGEEKQTSPISSPEWSVAAAQANLSGIGTTLTCFTTVLLAVDIKQVRLSFRIRNLFV